uniref:SET domain-containing protein n=1 Tax=Neobodo designis TaxID=312471 RepID=A0A6U4RV94_NEODS
MRSVVRRHGSAAARNACGALVSGALAGRTSSAPVAVTAVGSSGAVRAFGLGLHPFGTLTPLQGYCSPDIRCQPATEQTSGSTKRGVFAKRDLPYDRVLLRAPAVTYFVGDESVKDQCKEMTRWVLTKVASELDTQEKPFTEYVNHRIRNMMPGHSIVFTSEDDVIRFMMEIPKGMQIVKRQIFTTKDIHSLAMSIEMNRFAMNYDGRQGVALFPEASMFNHQCTPNVELTFHMNMNMEYVVEARVCQPVVKGDQLFVNYIPGNDLPITRLGMALRDRWGFECACAECKSRIMCATLFLFFFGMLPIMGPLWVWTMNRQKSAQKRAGFL